MMHLCTVVLLHVLITRYIYYEKHSPIASFDLCIYTVYVKAFMRSNSCYCDDKTIMCINKPPFM